MPASAASSRSAARHRGPAFRIATSPRSRRGGASIARAIAVAGSVRVPGDDYDGYIESHIRRLEALRRVGVVERINGFRWSIPADYEARAAAYDLAQSRRASLRVLSTYDLDRQIMSDGAIWLDRELIFIQPDAGRRGRFWRRGEPRANAAQGQVVYQGMATRTSEGAVWAPRDRMARLEQQEIARVGPEMARARGHTFKPQTGDYGSGTLVGPVNFTGGKFAMGDAGLGFSLVPWRPILERRLERHVNRIAIPTAISSGPSGARGLSP